MALEQAIGYPLKSKSHSLGAGRISAFGRISEFPMDNDMQELDCLRPELDGMVYLPPKIDDGILAKFGASANTTPSYLPHDSHPPTFQNPPCPPRPVAAAALLPTDHAADEDYKMQVLHGTTTLSFKYKGGVVVATDSRASSGEYIASQTVKKIIEIDYRLLGTMAGGAADCAFWERNLARYCRLYHLRNKQPISVAAASKLLSNILYGYRGMGLSVGTMICGVDKRGPTIVYVDSDGDRFPGTLFSVGSGSTYAYGVLDNGWRWDLSDDEAIDLAVRAIHHATFRDAGSGGFVRVYHIGENGWRPVLLKDVFLLHQERASKMGYSMGITPAPAKPVADSAAMVH